MNPTWPQFCYTAEDSLPALASLLGLQACLSEFAFIRYLFSSPRLDRAVV